jgi:hypothetical protein
MHSVTVWTLLYQYKLRLLIAQFADFRLLWYLTVMFSSWHLHHVDLGNVADILEVYATSILSVEVCFIKIIWSKFSLFQLKHCCNKLNGFTSQVAMITEIAYIYKWAHTQFVPSISLSTIVHSKTPTTVDRSYYNAHSKFSVKSLHLVLFELKIV